jgi:hypothetical protein
MRAFFGVVVAALLLPVAAPSIGMHAQGQSSAPSPNRQAELALDQERKARNGIVVGQPKVYDDALLQQMLNESEAKLAALTVLDQASLVKAFGAVSGANQRTSAFGVNIQTPALPGVTTAAKGAPGGTVTTSTNNVSVDGKPSSIDVVQTTTGVPVTDVTTVAPQATPPSVSAAAPAGAFPSAFSVSSSDLLNEQMQLTFEIANLRLMLEGAVSDRLFVSPNVRRVKPRITIGVPVTIEPDRRFKNAVAIVEVEYLPPPTSLANDEKPAVTAVLPREKTYNVAAITDSTTSIGAGVVTQVVGVSGSWFRGHKTYYLTRDQDTLGLTFQPRNPAAVGVRWQFKPVLGAEFVRAGLKQMFAQLSLPIAGDEPTRGTVKIRTYWRKLDTKAGVLKDITANSLDETVAEWTVPRYPLEVEPRSFDASKIEDLGNGQMLVRLTGPFLSGTHVRVGSATYRPGTPGAVFDLNGIRFVAPIVELTSKKTVLVSRDGEELPLEIPKTQDGAPTEKLRIPAILSASIAAFDEKRSVLTIDFVEDLDSLKPEPVIVAAGKAYGYTDAPIQREKRRLRAIVPTADIVNDPMLQVTSVFAQRGYSRSAQVTGLAGSSQTDRLLLLEAGKDVTKFLLYGHHLKDAEVLVPNGAKLEAIGQASDAETLATITLSADQLKLHKQLVLKRGTERPAFIAIPAIDAPAVKAAPTLKERVVVGADEAIFVGDDLKNIEKVAFGEHTLQFEVAKDGKSVIVRGLKKSGVTTTTDSKSIAFTFKAASTPVKVEVVSGKVETIAK